MELFEHKYKGKSIMIFFKYAWKDIKRIGWLSVLLVLFYTGVFIITVSIIAAVEIKTEDYMLMKPYMNQKGVILFPLVMAKKENDGGTLFRDDAEIREYISGVKDIVCIESIWAPVIAGFPKEVEAYVYNSEALSCMHPEMSEGRWFDEADNSSDYLSAVVTGNTNGRLHAGDVITLKTELDQDIEQKVLIIGVLADRSKILLTDMFHTPYEDYRDCFYVFDNATENKVLLLFSDEQIEKGRSLNRFPYMDFRVSPNKGFQKQVKGITILTFESFMSNDDIQRELDKLYEGKGAFFIHSFELSDFKKRSDSYVLEDVRTWFPLLLCVSLFVLSSSISINTIMVKRQLRNYAVYYLCGFAWGDCTKVSVFVSGMEISIAILLTVIIRFVTDIFKIGNMLFLFDGYYKYLAVLSVGFLFLILSVILPILMVRNSSAKQVLNENKKNQIN